MTPIATNRPTTRRNRGTAHMPVTGIAHMPVTGIVVVVTVLSMMGISGCASAPETRGNALPRTENPDIANPVDHDQRVIPSVKAPPPGAAIVAIVIDDCGESIEQIIPFLGIPVPITFGILPYLPAATETARTLARMGHETLAHMPMEPTNPKWLENDWFLRSGMDAADLRLRLDNALAAVPTATGINNHMGSRACADGNVMAVVMEHLKSRGLYYLDSRTTPESVARKAAIDAGIRSLSRDVFLDNDDDVGLIGGQIAELVSLARKNGCALGIGHARSRTAAAIMNYVRARDPGVVFVPAGRFFDYCPVSDRSQNQPE